MHNNYSGTIIMIMLNAVYPIIGKVQVTCENYASVCGGQCSLNNCVTGKAEKRERGKEGWREGRGVERMEEEGRGEEGRGRGGGEGGD